MKIVSAAARTLDDWLQPDLPEDLCLLRADDTAWLVSTAHETDAYMSLTHDETDLIAREAPRLMELSRPGEDEADG